MAQIFDSRQVRSYWEDLQAQRKDTEEKNSLLTTELIKRLTDLSQAYDTEVLDKERERAFSRQMQKENKELQERLDRIGQRVNRDASILVLVDGDGLLFDDRYVRDGESGGTEAAQDLYEKINRHVRQSMTDVPPDAKVVVRIYANMQGLCKTYADAHIASAATVTEFARGFTKGRAHFDFVDCGQGKERADNKISASFNLYINNIQTHHIFLGCSHDNGYARLLEELPNEDRGKVTLLEGIPFVRELYALKSKFATIKFDGLFRDDKIEVIHRRPAGKGLTDSPPFSSLQLSSPSPPEANGNGINTSDVLQRSASASTADSGPSRPPPGFTSPLGSASATITAAAVPTSSWAGRASTAAPTAQAGGARQGGNAVSTGTIKRNRKGQRIDPPRPKNLDDETVQKVQGMKLCNNFYLKSYCKLPNSQCSHDHYYKIQPMELEALRFVARRIPCINRGACEDPKCTAGHRCPWIQGGNCNFRDRGTCKFPPDMHHNDLTEVKTTTVR